jgi:Family of unknown function (DUF6221)
MSTAQVWEEELLAGLGVVTGAVSAERFGLSSRTVSFPPTGWTGRRVLFRMAMATYCLLRAKRDDLRFTHRQCSRKQRGGVMRATGLTEFLLARIAEDESAARAATDIDADEWSIDVMARSPDLHPLVTYVTDKYQTQLAQQQDPIRVLADCDAKRLIVAMHRAYMPTGDPVYSPDWSSGDWCVGCCYNNNAEHVTEHIDDCPILRALALPFATHPDFRDEWNLESIRHPATR